VTLKQNISGSTRHLGLTHFKTTWRKMFEIVHEYTEA